MAGLNKSMRKRKILSQESEFEIIDLEETCYETADSTQLSADLEVTEPESKIIKLEDNSSKIDSNQKHFINYFSRPGENKSTYTNDKQQLWKLESEIKRLQEENKNLQSKLCSCLKPGVTDEELVLTVVFNNTANFKLYKDKIMSLLETFSELHISEKDNLIYLKKDPEIAANEWLVVDNEPTSTSTSTSNVKKKKKKRSKKPFVPKEVFFWDTEPSIPSDFDVCYESKYSVLNTIGKNRESEYKHNGVTCFNCNEKHNLRDCPLPRNNILISAARQRFKDHQSIKTMRYHLETQRRYSHLKPGIISDKLREALGLADDQEPEYMYHMRQLDYPPGWLKELQDSIRSGLLLFDFDGKNIFEPNLKMPIIDPDLIIEYPGFNVPMKKGMKDEHRLYGCPAFSSHQSKENMLAFLYSAMFGIIKKPEDNLEICDMDIDNASSDKEIELAVASVTQEENFAVSRRGNSPTLRELESQKEELIAKLTESNNNTSHLEMLDNENKSIPNEVQDWSNKTLDVTGTVDILSESDNSLNNICDIPISNPIRNSSFGTPILKSSSPYCTLPNPINFSKNISPVIYFENLPNSTGKYKQMAGVLQKVRKTLKGLNDKN